MHITLKSGISQNFLRPKYFAHNLLVLRLASSEIVHNILQVEFPYLKSLIILTLTLFFMLDYLAAVNYKGKLMAKERISMLWLSFIFLLRSYSDSIVTKINCSSEVIYMSLLMMLDVLMRANVLDSDQFEH